MENTNIIMELIYALVPVLMSIGGCWVVVTNLLAKHNEKIDRIEKDIEEIKSDRKSIDSDLKDIFKLISKMDRTLGILEERSKKG